MKCAYCGIETKKGGTKRAAFRQRVIMLKSRVAVVGQETTTSLSPVLFAIKRNTT